MKNNEIISQGTLEAQKALFDASDKILPNDFPLIDSADHMSIGEAEGVRVWGSGYDLNEGKDVRARGRFAGAYNNGESSNMSSIEWHGDSSLKNKIKHKTYTGNDDEIIPWPLADSQSTLVDVASNTPTAQTWRRASMLTGKGRDGEAVASSEVTAEIHKQSVGEHSKRKGGMEPTRYESHISEAKRERYAELLSKLALKRVQRAKQTLQVRGVAMHTERVEHNYDD